MSSSFTPGPPTQRVEGKYTEEEKLKAGVQLTHRVQQPLEVCLPLPGHLRERNCLQSTFTIATLTILIQDHPPST